MIEVLKQSLEALELALRSHGVMLLSDPPQDAWKTYGVESNARQSITSLRQAIAELESQEPVAWMFQHDETGRMNYVSNDGIHNPNMFLEMNPRYALVCPLYTHPPQRTWVGLTDEEIASVANNNHPLNGIRSFARAIEAKLKELNS